MLHVALPGCRFDSWSAGEYYWNDERENKRHAPSVRQKEGKSSNRVLGVDEKRNWAIRFCLLGVFLSHVLNEVPRSTINKQEGEASKNKMLQRTRCSNVRDTQRVEKLDRQNYFRCWEIAQNIGACVLLKPRTIMAASMSWAHPSTKSRIYDEFKQGNTEPRHNNPKLLFPNCMTTRILTNLSAQPVPFRGAFRRSNATLEAPQFPER